MTPCCCSRPSLPVARGWTRCGPGGSTAGCYSNSARPCYAEHTGTGTREAVDRRLAAVTAHERMMSDKRTMRRPDTARQARDIMHPGAECIGENDSVATAA